MEREKQRKTCGMRERKKGKRIMEKEEENGAIETVQRKMKTNEGEEREARKVSTIIVLQNLCYKLVIFIHIYGNRCFSSY